MADSPEGAAKTRPLRNDSPVISYPNPLALVAVIAGLYFARDVLIPLAVAVLLTFALAPLVSRLRKFGLPKPAAVIAAVTSALGAIIITGVVLTSQIGTLADNLPVYQRNLETKIAAIKDADFGEGFLARVSELLDRLGREIDEAEPSPDPDPADEAPDPLPVQIVEPPAEAFEVIQTVLGPLVQPLATGGIVIVLVVFMLMRREDLRDRFIRLVGAGDLHRTTEAIQDAGTRVGRYLLMQLIVNLIYAVPIGIGLWLVGVPNAPLWGLLALLLRFIPYIGPIIAAIFPLSLALAVDPGWSMVLWTAALFVSLELVINNVVEPWLYGSRTGLSSLAIIVSAVFWTWLWGPVGLLLSTPLTVCLVVLGRHVPRFEFLDVVLGNEPVLEAHQQLYQRLLAGDPDEATERAETLLKQTSIIDLYETVAIPALALGETDRARGVLGEDRRQRMASSAFTLVDNLEDYANDHQTRIVVEEASEDSEQMAPLSRMPDASGVTVLCAGGRGDLDNVAAAALAQVLRALGADSRAARNADLDRERIGNLNLGETDAVIVGFLNPASETHARYVVRRIKRSHAGMLVGVIFWSRPMDHIEFAKLQAAIGCDFVCNSITSTVEGLLAASKTKKPLPDKTRKPSRRNQRDKVEEPSRKSATVGDA